MAQPRRIKQQLQVLDQACVHKAAASDVKNKLICNSLELSLRV